MSEHMSPIPSRIYNASVGGHVCGPEDVDFGQKVVHLVKYDKAGNEVSFESQVNQSNKIYVIHDDFILSSNVTIPANCVLEFDGGSISGAYTVTFTSTYLDGDVNIATNVLLAGSIENQYVDLRWFGAKCDGTTDDVAVWNKVLVFQGLASNNFAIRFTGISYVGSSILITSNKVCIEGASPNNSVITTDQDIVIISNTQSIPDLFFGKTRIDNILLKNTASEKKATGIYFNNVHGSEFHNIQFQNLSIGIVLYECALNIFNNFSFIQVNNAIVTQSWSNTNIFIGGLVYYSTIGNSSEGVYSIKFVNTDFESFASAGPIYVNGRVEFDGCSFENIEQTNFTWIYINGNNNKINENCYIHYHGVSVPPKHIEINGNDNIINLRNIWGASDENFFVGNSKNNKVILWDADLYNASGKLHNFSSSPYICNLGENTVVFKSSNSSVSITKDTFCIDEGVIEVIPFNYTERALGSTVEVSELFDSPDYQFNYHGTIATSPSFSRIIYSGIKTIQSGEEGYYTVTSVVKSDNPGFACTVGFVAGEFVHTLKERNKWCIVSGFRYFNVGDTISVCFDFNCTSINTGRIDICKCTITKGLRPIMFDTPIACEITPSTPINQYIGGKINTNKGVETSGKLKKIASNIAVFSNYLCFSGSSVNYSDMTVEFENVYIKDVIKDIHYSINYPTVAGTCSISDGKIVLPNNVGIHNNFYILDGVMIIEPRYNG